MMLPQSGGLTDLLPDNPSLNESSAIADDASVCSSDSTTSLVEEDEEAEALLTELNTETEDKVALSATLVRCLALLCACSLSIGSHYGQYFLGPLKSRLSREVGTNNTQFSLLLAAFNINNTWTPLLGGIMAARFGAAWTSIIASSLILSGQTLLLLGDYLGQVYIMVAGLFIFGLGISPLAVAQETIIVRFFCKHGLGVSLALGLVAGKATSFFSALSSYPLSQRFGPHAPFVVSTLLAAMSFGFNIIFLLASNWFTRGAGVAPDAADVQRQVDQRHLRVSGERMSEQEAIDKVVAKRWVRVKDLTVMGDVFWIYIAVNALCGAIWSPFTHLAANIFEKRYNLSELDASKTASLLLAGSLALYPICGLLTDRLKKGPVVHLLFMLSSGLTLFCYSWLVLPVSWTQSPMPAIFAFSGGHGFSTLLLVILVPHLVPLQYVSTALGAHKSIESCGSTISKILAGLILDTKHLKNTPQPGHVSHETMRPPIDNGAAIQWLLTAWLAVNLLQLLGTILLWKTDTRRKLRDAQRSAAGFQRPSSSDVSGYQPLSISEAEGGTEPVDIRATFKANLIDHSIPNPWLEQDGEQNVASSSNPVPKHASDGGLQAEPSPRRSGPSPSRVRYKFPSYTIRRPTSPLRTGHSRHYSASFTTVSGKKVMAAASHRERRRGKVFMILGAGLIVGTWTLFFATMWTKRA